jgi:hypothetical protein
VTHPPDKPAESQPDESAENTTTPRSDWEVPGGAPKPPPEQAQLSGSTVSPDWGPPLPGAAQPWGDQQGWAPESQRWGAASRPGVVPLRPLSVGEILDGAITYIRRNPSATLGTAAVLTAISGAIQAFILSAVVDQVSNSLLELTDDTAAYTDVNATALGVGQLLGLALGSAVGWAIGILATGMLTVMMGAAVLGRKIDIASAWRTFLPRLPSLLVLTILVSAATLGILLLGVIIAGIMIAVGGIAGVLISVPVALIAVGAATWLWIRLLLAPAVLILEGVGPLRAWRRSMALVRRSWWRVFGIQLLATIIATVIAGVVSVPFQTVAGAATSPDGEPTTLFWVLVTIGSVVAGVITLPFTAGVVSLLYLDRRMRREGLDLILRSPAAEKASMGPMASAEPTVAAWISVYRANIHAK